MTDNTKISFEEAFDQDSTEGMIRAEISGKNEDLVRMLVAVFVGNIREDGELVVLFESAIKLAKELADKEDSFRHLRTTKLPKQVN